MPGGRSLLVLWVAQLVSSLGSGVSSFGLGVWVYERTHSTMDFAMLPLATTLPSVLLAPVVGHLVDRAGRRRVLVASDLLSGLVMAILWSVARAGALEPWHGIAASVFLGISASAHGGALDASVLPLVGEENLVRANSFLAVARVMTVLAPLGAAALYAAGGISFVLAVDASCCVLAALLELGARIPDADRVPDETQGLGDGFARIFADRPLLSLLGFLAFMNFSMGVVEVTLTPIVLDAFDQRFLALVMLASGAGGVVGSVASTIVPSRRPLSTLALAGAGAGAALVVAGLVRPGAGFAVGAFAYMTAYVMVGPLSQSLWQVRVPAAVQGRVFVARQAMTNAAFPLAHVLTGPIVDHALGPAFREGGSATMLLGGALGAGPSRGAQMLVAILGVLSLGLAAWLRWASRARHLAAEPSPADG